MPNKSDQARPSVSLRSIVLRVSYSIVNFLISIGDTVISLVVLLITTVGSLIYKIYAFGAFIVNGVKARLRRLSNLKQSPKLKKKDIIFNLKLRYFILGVVVALLLFAARESSQFIQNLPNPTLIGKVNYPVSTQIYDRNDVLLFEVYKDANRTPISLDELPEYVANATIAIEDKDYYNHNGVALYG